MNSLVWIYSACCGCFLVDELRIRKMMVEGTIMIEAFVPGEQWEIDLLASGEIEVERFESTGVRRFDAHSLGELAAMLADRRPLRERKSSRKPPQEIR